MNDNEKRAQELIRQWHGIIGNGASGVMKFTMDVNGASRRTDDGSTAVQYFAPIDVLAGLTVQQCLEQFEQRIRSEGLRPHAAMTLCQLSAAHTEWSRQLREKQAEARRKEREQVVIDLDY